MRLLLLLILGAGLGTISLARAAGTLTADQARAVVLIKGDKAEGTGFMVKTADGPAVITNIHVLSDNPNVRITTSTGVSIAATSLKGAIDRDLAMIGITDASFSYLELSPNVSGSVQPGDAVITPGNSEGGEVMLNTTGQILGIGPDRIEFNNPIYHGNSGGPVYHVKSGTVIGVVTEAMKVDNTDDLDKASFASRNSAIKSSMRYFGLRLDTVPQWETYDWNRLQTETAFLDQFDQRSRCLDSYLNTPTTQQAAPAAKKHKHRKKKKDPQAPGNTTPPDTSGDSDAAELWRQDDKIVKANDGFIEETASSADISQQVDAVRELYADINDVASLGMDVIQDPKNFYGFDQQRAKEELAYRKALQTELEAIGKDVSRMGGMPRTNN